MQKMYLRKKTNSEEEKEDKGKGTKGKKRNTTEEEVERNNVPLPKGKSRVNICCKGSNDNSTCTRWSTMIPW